MCHPLGGGAVRSFLLCMELELTTLEMYGIQIVKWYIWRLFKAKLPDEVYDFRLNK